MIQNNYFSDNQDIQDHFINILPWTEIILDYENDFSGVAEGGPSNPSEAKEYYKTVSETWPGIYFLLTLPIWIEKV